MFFVKMKEWSVLNDHVIGHVVIKLDEKKFGKNFKGNIID